MANPVQGASHPGEWQVLIIEDDAFLAALYSSFLSSKDMCCVVANTVAEAQQQLQTVATFNLILLDQVLPDGEGLSLLPWAKKHHPLAPVIMISGNEESSFFIDAFNQGVDDYVVKPINIELLWIKVIKLLERRSLQQQVVQQKNQLSRWQDEKQVEFYITEHLLEHVVNKINQPAKGVRHWTQASTELSGDLFLQRQGADGSWYFLLADATGHGLAAAVSLLPMIDIFKDGVDRLQSLSKIVYRINEQLGWYIPVDRFVAAITIHVQPQRNQLDVWNASMPSALLLHDTGVLELPAQSLAMGIVNNRQLRSQVQSYALDQCQRLLMFSDGLIETQDGQQQFLDTHRLTQQLSTMSCEALFEHLLTFSMDELAPQAVDDLSFALIDLATLLQSSAQSTAPVAETSTLDCDLCLQGLLLDRFHYLPLLQQLLLPLQLLPSLQERIILVACELIKNAYEHGISPLNPGLGNQQEQRIRVQLRCRLDEQHLELTITDSGQGFAYAQQELSHYPEHEQPRGRGLLLAQHFSQQLSFNEQGNQVCAQWSWQATDDTEPKRS